MITTTQNASEAQAKSKAPEAAVKADARPASPKPVKASKPVKVAKPAKTATAKTATSVRPVDPLKKDKLVRDSFTLPREDFELIAVLKDRALDFKRPTKKSELIRAGLQILAGLEQTAFQAALEALRPLKAGRPKHKA